MLTNNDIEKLKEVLATKDDVHVIRADLANLEKKTDDIGEAVNSVADRVSRLMTKEEAISLFDMATLKTEHDHIKKILREKLHVEV